MFKRMMTFKNLYKVLAMIALEVMVNGCIEPFELATENFEDILVIEGTITNENKQHEILLSRAVMLDDNGLNKESNASVKIIDKRAEEYIFEETVKGKYVSTMVFQPKPDRSYQLMIITADNRAYVSSSVTMPPSTTLENVYAERTTNDDGLEGIGIFADSFSSGNTPVFIRYSYDETYKIRPPFASGVEPVVPYRPFLGAMCGEPAQIPKPVDDLICYNTNSSTNILLASTNGLSENRIKKFRVRFIGRNNFIIRERYSILVNQFTQSTEAYNFYRILKEFSDLENLFAQLQTGFISGNIVRVDNPQEKVLGFFEISPISSKRIFYNFEDFFPEGPRPPFAVRCELRYVNDDRLVENINNGIGGVYVGSDCNREEEQHFFVGRICSDCRVLGSSIIPDFWEN